MRSINPRFTYLLFLLLRAVSLETSARSTATTTQVIAVVDVLSTGGRRCGSRAVNWRLALSEERRLSVLLLLTQVVWEMCWHCCCCRRIVFVIGLLHVTTRTYLSWLHRIRCTSLDCVDDVYAERMFPQTAPCAVAKKISRVHVYCYLLRPDAMMLQVNFHSNFIFSLIS